MASFQVGTWVWIQHEDEKYLPAKVLTSFKKGDTTTVMTEDGEKRKLDAAATTWACDCNPEALVSKMDDLISISDLNEMSILHQLRIRFKEDKIYTNISSILVSVNPFKLLPLYTPDMLDKYRNGSRDKPPHIFAIAYNAYNNMMTEGEDQCAVCSGESGAGKSEATKLLLQFLTDVSSRNSVNPGNSNQLEQQILASNPILEAFGNAKTLRNNNSSRFGKLITVNFDSHGGIIGGNIINYLLEKSRIVQPGKGERSYHIFYQLLSAAETDPALTDALKLQNPELFEYTGQSGVIHIDGVSDEKDFEDMQNSMNILRFSPTEKSEIFKVVAGVLHFGNIKFKVEKHATKEDSSTISNPEVADHAAKMWGIKAADIKKLLVTRNVGTKEIIEVSLSVAQALDTRDAMTKRVYSELFQFIVNKINIELSTNKKPRHKFIGVLDIFGFESFEVNSFEQLCINFCNEKLQFHFNEHIFKMEQTLYKAEGITIPSSSFVDNQPTLDLLELKMTGVFAMMDEEINVPKGSDEGFLSKVFKQHEKKHPNMIKPGVRDCKDSQKNFGVLHYAGPVFYNVTGFLEKNKDQLSVDLQNVLRSSTMVLMQTLFKDADTASGGKPKAKLTVGAQFKNQLNELVATLNSTFPHFVRCMKSNDKKSGNLFTAGRMLDQLKYAGLVEVCRIRKLGYPVRRTFQEFYKRFKPIELTCMNLDALLKVLSDRKILKQGEWAKGFTKVFYRTAQAGELELAREKAFLKVAIKVQKVARGILFRKRYKRCKQIIVNLREAIKKRSDSALTDALNMCGELPYAGTHMKLVAEAKGLHARIKEESKVLKLLENAMAIKEVNGINSAIEAAQSMKPAFTPPLLAEAQALVLKIESEQAAKTALSTAVASRDLKQLADAIAKANAIKLVCNELQQAVSLKARIEEENSVISKLNDAAKAKNIDAMNDLMSKCAELGITNRPEVAAHKKLHEQLAEENRKKAEKDGKTAEAAKKQKEALEAAGKKREAAMAAAESKLTEAMNNGDMNRVNALLNDAMQLGLASEVVKQAQQFLKAQDTSTGVQSQLEACVKVLRVKADTGITEQDLLPLRNAITKARQANLPELQKSLKEAEEAHILYQKHVTAAAGLKAALNSKDRLQLRRALDEAENLDLQIEIMASAKEILRELEIAYRAQKAAGDIVENVEPYDAAEEARKARQEVAKQARFDVKNFPNLRTADDYARGAILNKAKVKEQFLVFQNSVVPKSLLDLNKENNKLAMQIHKDLLGYMGDKQMPFPAMLAQDILRKGYEYKPIRDEIYMQIIKQLTQNPRPESVAKGWQIMCMCVGTFPPSFDFENFLLHYIIEKRDKGRGAVVDYARYCLRTLEAMLSNGDGTGFVPSVEEILAYKERPPILATIHLVDGNVITEDLPITPDLNVGKVLEMCSGWLDLKDSRVDSLGMFVYDCGETEDAASMDESYKNAPYRDLIRTPRPLRNDDYMGDIIVQRARQRRKFKFVIKRKIFLPQHNGRGSDPFYERLNYLQAEDETIIQGNIDINDEEKVVALAGISMAVAFGEEMGGTIEELVAANVQDFIPPAWREKKSPDAWANLILQTRDSLVSSDPEDLQDQFLQIVQESPLYGTHWFYVYKVDTPPSVAVPPAVKSLPREIMLGFNAEGMHVYSLNRQLLVSFPYADIYRWGGSSSQFSLIMADASLADSFEFVIITGQAADMAAIILDHIRAIMSEQEAAEAEG